MLRAGSSTTTVADFLATHPVFTRDELVTALDPGGKGNSRRFESILSHHASRGHILRVRRGLYATVPRPLSPESVPVDPLLVAAKLAEDAVLAYHGALEHYAKAYSTHSEYVSLSAHVVRPFTFRGQRFRTVPFPRAAGRGTPIRHGLLPQERQGVVFQVTTLERTLVDVLDRPELSGGWEEVWRSLEQIEFVDVDEVVKYALLLGNATAAAKVGFYLEQHREALMLDDKPLERLRKHVPQQAHYMDRRSRLPSRLVSGWNLLVPVNVLERSWEEPS